MNECPQLAETLKMEVSNTCKRIDSVDAKLPVCTVWTTLRGPSWAHAGSHTE